MNRMNQLVGILVFFAVCGFSCVTANQDPASNEKPSTGEPVKKLITKVIDVQVPRLIREEIRFSDGTLSQARVLSYDVKGNLVREDLLNHHRSLLSSKTYQYAADGSTQTETTTTATGEVQGLVVRKLDNKGHVLTETLLNGKKEVQSFSEFGWDAYGNMLTWISRSPDNQIIISTKYQVQNNKVTAIDMLDANNMLIKHFDQKWDKQGLLAQKIETDPSRGILSVLAYQYQDKLLQREDYSKADGVITRSLVYSYGGLTVPSEIRLLDRNGQVNEIRTAEYQVFTHPETIQVLE